MTSNCITRVYSNKLKARCQSQKKKHNKKTEDNSSYVWIKVGKIFLQLSMHNCKFRCTKWRRNNL